MTETSRRQPMGEEQIKHLKVLYRWQDGYTWWCTKCPLHQFVFMGGTSLPGQQEHMTGYQVQTALDAFDRHWQQYHENSRNDVPQEIRDDFTSELHDSSRPVPPERTAAQEHLNTSREKKL